MKLTEFVIQNAILPNLKATSKEEVIREMVSHLKAAGALKATDEEAVVAVFGRHALHRAREPPARNKERKSGMGGDGRAQRNRDPEQVARHRQASRRMAKAGASPAPLRGSAV